MTATNQYKPSNIEFGLSEKIKQILIRTQVPVASRVNLRSKDQNTEKQSFFYVAWWGERIPERPLLGKIAFENRALKDTWSSHVMCVTPKKKMRNWNPPNFIVVQKSGKLLTTKLSGPFSPTSGTVSKRDFCPPPNDFSEFRTMRIVAVTGDGFNMSPA